MGASCSSSTVPTGCDCDLDSSSAPSKVRLRVGCGIGVSSAPIQFALQHTANVELLSFSLHWVKCPPDADAVLAMLSAGLLDLAIIHTEDAVLALLTGTSMRMCGTFAASPRRWGLYTQSQVVGELPDKKALVESPLAVPMNCLGAQLAIAILRNDPAFGGFCSDAVYLQEISTVEQAFQALATGRVQAVLWEQHAASEYVAQGQWCPVWEGSLPWSSSVFIANREAIYSKSRSIQSFIAWTRSTVSDFLQAENADLGEQLLASSHHLTRRAALCWLESVSWNCLCEVQEACLTKPALLLHQLGKAEASALALRPAGCLAKDICILAEDRSLRRTPQAATAAAVSSPSLEEATATATAAAAAACLAPTEAGFEDNIMAPALATAYLASTEAGLEDHMAPVARFI
ncbi:unnamed protein product [Polarella glacialis]|uniref:Thiamine pyrimidine synthase n=1 Tax=Polarella glacialis TaxID=89957 RepID=A0A813FMD5_POLGL|nr:unnamed protein product [Polarella glacialis]